MNKYKLSNFIIFILPILCIFQSYMGMTSGLLELIFLWVLALLIGRFINGTIIIDQLSIFLILIVVISLITMFVFKITQTSWINVFRSNLFAMAIYLYVINYKSHINITIFKYPFLMVNLFNIWVLTTTWSSGFTHHSVELSYFNLNNIGIISLLIMIMSLTLYVKNVSYRLTHSFNIILSFLLVILSFSRSNYVLLICVVLFILLFILDLKGRAKFLALVSLIFLFFLFEGIESDVFNYGLSFLDKKINVAAPEDIFLGRLYDVAIMPVVNYLQERNFILIFLGGSLIPEHSLLITHVTCFGLFSMILYLLVTFQTIKHIKHQNKVIKLASLLMLVVFINDSSTNASTYLAFIKLIPFAFFGLIIRENNEKHYKLRW